MERHFDQELEDIKASLLDMGGKVESQLENALLALSTADAARAHAVIDGDRAVNVLQMEIDDRCLKALALHQPAAVDLRLITGAMKIVSELERIGDQAVNIAQSALHYMTRPPLKPLVDIPLMGRLAREMVRNSLDAFVRRDPKLARDVLRNDDTVDALRDQVFRELLTYMLADTRTINQALSLILISRHLERVADHATNIAEDVVFVVQGTDIRHHALEAT